MAEELYREWFVRMRFPGHKETKFVKGVPEGWEVIPIGSLCEEVRTHIKKKDLPDDAFYIGLEHIPRKSIALKECATADSIDSDKLCFKKRDILFGKIRPYLHKISLAHFSGACSSDIIVLRPINRTLEGFLLFTVFNDSFVEMATSASKGTKMPRADWDFLQNLKMVVPPSKLLMDYQTRFEEVFSLIETLLLSNQKTTQTRDLLLPRLISGKLSVEDLDIQFPPSMQEAKG
jgi:type I restriction enzyme S subunit